MHGRPATSIALVDHRVLTQSRGGRCASAIFIVEALVDVGFGAALILAPRALLYMYGMATDRDGTFFCQFLGATLVGFGVFVWSARNWTDTDARRLLIRVLFLTTTLGFVVSAGYQVQPGVPAPTAAFAALTLAFAVAWGWFAYRTFR